VALSCDAFGGRIRCVAERYALSNTDEERERLARQGDLMRPATERLFRAAGIAPGDRVLDCGSGAGDVSLIAAELVTSAGEVVGIDRDSDQVAAANRRVTDIGLSHVRFETAELSAPPPGRFDAIVGRMVLKYLPEPEAVLRVLADRLVPGGVMAFLEWDFMRSAEWGNVASESIDGPAHAMERRGVSGTWSPRADGIAFAVAVSVGWPDPAAAI
jgi:ubiquinone/menaquinone biosynthesis C-methylase UbiE